MRACSSDIPILCGESVANGMKRDNLFEELEARFAVRSVREVGKSCATPR